jgi:hypothetical protein
MHVVDDAIDFLAFVCNVKHAQAEAVVTAICRVGTQSGVFGIAPGARNFACFGAVMYRAFHGLVSLGGFTA